MIPTSISDLLLFSHSYKSVIDLWSSALKMPRTITRNRHGPFSDIAFWQHEQRHCFDLQRWHILTSPHLIKSVPSHGPSALGCLVSQERIVHQQLCAMDVVPLRSFFPRHLALILLISVLDIQTSLASPGE